jgi:hypothetical protein
MKNDEILALLDSAIENLLKNDDYLLSKDISERSISHKLAVYLEPLFSDDYDVDCEYNGDVDSDNNRKFIQILKSALDDFNIELNKREKADPYNLLVERDVYPDIIIHRRGENKNNLCIIEIKKSSSSRIKCDYDLLKLKAYTSNSERNHLQYQLGVFIYFIVKQEKPTYNRILFENGVEIK